MDADQITRLTYDEAARAMKTISSGGTLVPESYDEIVLTYDGSSNIETVTYYANAVQIALLTLAYDGSNRLTSVIRT